MTAKNILDLRSAITHFLPLSRLLTTPYLHLYTFFTPFPFSDHPRSLFRANHLIHRRRYRRGLLESGRAIERRLVFADSERKSNLSLVHRLVAHATTPADTIRRPRFESNFPRTRILA